MWTPFIGEILQLREESRNKHDPYAVAVVKDDDIVGHVPCEFSRVFSFFLKHDGNIHAKVTGHRKLGCGLEVPCCYKLTSKPSTSSELSNY